MIPHLRFSPSVCGLGVLHALAKLYLHILQQSKNHIQITLKSYTTDHKTLQWKTPTTTTKTPEHSLVVPSHSYTIKSIVDDSKHYVIIWLFYTSILNSDWSEITNPLFSNAFKYSNSSIVSTKKVSCTVQVLIVEKVSITLCKINKFNSL